MQLKVCGMKYPDNIKAVAALRPNYMGFIFYEKSVRYFNGTIPELPENIKKTGVFVDAPISEVTDKITKYNLQAVQLHGSELPEYCKDLKKFSDEILNSTLEIIKAFSIQNDFNFETLKPYESVCDYFLFDTKGKLPGGNGYTFDWNILNQYPLAKPYFLSGGIGVGEIDLINAFKASKAYKYCYALDVNSKFEIEPGLKNVELLNEFVKKNNAKKQ
ncbi:MAG: phosphoribosylanthranilate isomerase [Flavobacteriaceae bacterium]